MSKSKNPWKTLATKEIYKNPWIRLREAQVIKPDGSKGIYGVVQVKPAVIIVAVDNQKRICLVNLFRYTPNNFSWETPSGGAESSRLLENAKRELKEETGIRAGKWKKIGSYNSLNGICDDVCYTFLARDLIFNSKNNQHEEGIIKMKFFSLKEIFAMIAIGEFTDSQSITAITQVAVYLKFI